MTTGKGIPPGICFPAVYTHSSKGGIPGAQHLQQLPVRLNPGVAAGRARPFHHSLTSVLGRAQGCFGGAKGHKAVLVCGWCERRRTAELLLKWLGWPAPRSATFGPSQVSHSGVGGVWKKVNKTEDGVNKKKLIDQSCKFLFLFHVYGC